MIKAIEDMLDAKRKDLIIIQNFFKKDIEYMDRQKDYENMAIDVLEEIKVIKGQIEVLEFCLKEIEKWNGNLQ